MGEYVTLLGAEEVRRAGNEMKSAAEQISQAVSWLVEAMDQQRRFQDEWLQRFEAALDTEEAQ